MQARLAREEEHDAIEALLVATMVDDGLGEDEARTWAPRLIGEQIGGAVVVLEDGDRLVGLCHAVRDEDDALEIVHLYVDPRLRGHGTGLKLLVAASRHFLEVSPCIVTWIDAECRRLRSMFELAGFTLDEMWRSLPEVGRAEIRLSRKREHS